MRKNSAEKSPYAYTPVIIVLCFLIIFISLGFCSSGRTLYLTAITDALDLPRGAFSLSNSLRFITSSIVNLFFGRLVARFGTKKLICAGFAFLIAFALINSIATGLLAFYAAGILLGIGLSWTSTTMISTIINKWCQQNRGSITGSILAANGIGGAIAVQILSPIIFQEGNAFGYRTSYRLVAVILAIALLLILVLYREPPKRDEISLPSSPKKHKIRGAGWVGMEYRDVIKKPYFYVSLACMFLIGIVLQGLAGIATPHMYDIGMDVDFVAIVVSVGSVMLTITKFLTGFFYDRFGLKLAMNIALVSAFVSMAILAFLQNTPTGCAFAVIQTTIRAFAMPLETVMLSIFAMEFFGNKPFDKLIGLFVSSSAIGCAVGESFGNMLYDVFGNYTITFILFSMLMAIAAVALQFVLRAAHRDKKIILDALETVV